MMLLVTLHVKNVLFYLRHAHKNKRKRPMSTRKHQQEKNSVVRVLAMSLLCWFRYFIVIFMHYHDKTETNAT